MDGLRARLTPTLTEAGLINIKLEWVDVIDSKPGEVKLTEEFQMSPEKGAAGCAVFSRACFTEGEELPLTFWTDENGARHFHAKADFARMNLFGAPVALVKE